MPCFNSRTTSPTDFCVFVLSRRTLDLTRPFLPSKEIFTIEGIPFFFLNYLALYQVSQKTLLETMNLISSPSRMFIAYCIIPQLFLCKIDKLILENYF